MLYSGSKGGEFKSYWRHSVTVSLSKPFYPLLSTCSTQYDRKMSRHNGKMIACEVKHQYKLIFFVLNL